MTSFSRSGRRAIASATRSSGSDSSMTWAGSGASGSWRVSSSETWSPLVSETVQSSSRAAMVEFEIWISASWKSSGVISSPGANGPRHPVQRAQLVDDRSLDARNGVGLELDVAVGLEALDRRDQADEPV